MEVSAFSLPSLIGSIHYRSASGRTCLEERTECTEEERGGIHILHYMALCASDAAMKGSEDCLLCMHFCVDDCFSVISISKC